MDPLFLFGIRTQPSPMFPPTIETQTAVIFTEPKDVVDSPINFASGTRKTVMFTEPEETDTFANSAKAKPLTAQQSSVFPLTIETQKPATFTEQGNVAKSHATSSVGIRKTVTFAESEEMDTNADSLPTRLAKQPLNLVSATIRRPPNKSNTWSAATELQNPTSVAERWEAATTVVGDAMDLSSDYTPPQNVVTDTISKQKSNAQDLIDSWGFQNPSSRRHNPSTSVVSIDDRLDRSNKAGRSLGDTIVDLVIEEKSLVTEEHEQKATEMPSYGITHGEDSHTGDGAALLPWGQIQGNTYQTVKKCTVFGSIFRGDQFVTLVAFVGLPFPVRTMLLSIKAPPRELNIYLRYRCVAADYRKYFHSVSIIFILFPVGLVERSL